MIEGSRVFYPQRPGHVLSSLITNLLYYANRIVMAVSLSVNCVGLTPRMTLSTKNDRDRQDFFLSNFYYVVIIFRNLSGGHI